MFDKTPTPTSLIQCNAILRPADQYHIKSAANFAALGQHDAAEQHRVRAGYGATA